MEPKPVSDVTSANYRELASDFIKTSDGQGFVIALTDGKAQGFKYRATIHQWGAWAAFFKKINLNTPFMKSRNYWAVPAEWPHLFTSDASEAEDRHHGAQFARALFDKKLAKLPEADHARMSELRETATANETDLLGNPKPLPLWLGNPRFRL